MISVEINFYAQLKDFFGEKTTVEISDGATAAEIRGALAAKNALAADWLKVSRLASDDAFLNEEQQVAGGAGITFCRRRVGGNMISAKISQAPLDLSDLLKRFAHNQAGARVFFSGEVRASNHGKVVTHLEYSAHKLLAEKHMEEVLETAMREFGILSALCVHRVGNLQVLESAVVVLTCGRHRGETYAANRYIIDRVKAETPIWKKEFFADGTSVWGENCNDTAGHAHSSAHHHA